MFGSYAKGTYTLSSSIEVCIIADKISNNFLATLAVTPIATSVDARIEPVVFSMNDYLYESDFSLLKEVKNTGLEIT